MEKQPSIPLSRRKRKAALSEPIRLYVEKLAEERRQRRDKKSRDPSPVVREPPKTTRTHRRSLYLHKRIVAVLSIGTDGFTLSNSVESVSNEGGLCNAVEEVVKMKVRSLHCFDESTHKKWQTLTRESVYKFQKLDVAKMKPFPRIRCTFCKEKVCHRWNANAGIAHLLKIPFDPIAHSAENAPGRLVHRHEKIVAVLCIGLDGWTLCNGVNSVSENGRLSNSSVAREVIAMKVRILNCFDDATHAKWTDIQKSYAREFKKLQVAKLTPIKMRGCMYCDKKTCHRWRASVGLSDLYKMMIFDPIAH